MGVANYNYLPSGVILQVCGCKVVASAGGCGFAQHPPNMDAMSCIWVFRSSHAMCTSCYWYRQRCAVGATATSPARIARGVSAGSAAKQMTAPNTLLLQILQMSKRLLKNLCTENWCQILKWRRFSITQYGCEVQRQLLMRSGIEFFWVLGEYSRSTRVQAGRYSKLLLPLASCRCPKWRFDATGLEICH